MQIDQRHVTTVNLHDGSSRDFVLQPDCLGYKLILESPDDVVHILLSPHDLTKLRHELGKDDVRETRAGKEYRPAVETRPSVEVREAADEDGDAGGRESYV